MNTSLLRIQQKVNRLQKGMLRFRDKQGQLTLHVKTTTNEDASLNCIITEKPAMPKLINREVKFIQKSYYDYVYITGTVASECQNGSRIVSIQILKAYWFVRRSTGNFSWLKEKYAFESPVFALQS
jgi:hypothetical protein